MDEGPFRRRKGTCNTHGGLSHRPRRSGEAPDGESRARGLGFGAGNLRAFPQPGKDGFKDDRQDRDPQHRGEGLRDREFLQDIRGRAGRGGGPVCGRRRQAEGSRRNRTSVHGQPAGQEAVTGGRSEVVERAGARPLSGRGHGKRKGVETVSEACRAGSWQEDERKNGAGRPKSRSTGVRERRLSGKRILRGRFPAQRLGAQVDQASTETLHEGCGKCQAGHGTAKRCTEGAGRTEAARRVRLG